MSYNYYSILNKDEDINYYKQLCNDKKDKYKDEQLCNDKKDKYKDNDEEDEIIDEEMLIKKINRFTATRGLRSVYKKDSNKIKDEKENIFRFYGLYGIKEDGTPNYRTQYKNNSNSSPYEYKREYSYIHEKYPNILEHLKEYYDENNIKHYNKIKTFQFVPYIKLSDQTEEDVKDIKTVESLIDHSYLHELLIDDMIPFTGLHIIREMNFRGYSSDVANEYIKIYKNKIKKILKEKFKIDVLKNQDFLKQEYLDKSEIPNIESELLEKRKRDLIKGYFRSCENVENIKGAETYKKPTENKLVLQDLLNNVNEKQLLLGSVPITKLYTYRKDILISPWFNRGLEMGIYSWNLSINKSMISCFISNTLAWLFPIRLLFEYHPKYLSFENVELTSNYYEQLKYLGFFIIRYINIIIRGIDISKNCKGFYYNSQDKLPDLKNIHDQYLVLFVFKDLNLKNIARYKIVNFRLNYVEWGNFSEWKRIFFMELIQVMCYNLTKQINYYALLKKSDDLVPELNKICNNQFEKNDKKKDIMKCFESYFFPETFKIIQDLNFHPYSELTCLHVLISSKNEEEIIDILKKKEMDDYKIDIINKYINIKVISTNEEYILFPCHLKWDKNHNFGLNYGKLDLKKLDLKDKENTLNYYNNTLCIKSKCILNRDIPKYNMLNNIFNYKDDEDKELFYFDNIKFTKNYLLSYFKLFQKEQHTFDTIKYLPEKLENPKISKDDAIKINKKIKYNDKVILILQQMLLSDKYDELFKNNINKYIKTLNMNKIIMTKLIYDDKKQSGGNILKTTNNNKYYKQFLKSANNYYILNHNFISIINTYDKNIIDNIIKKLLFYNNSTNLKNYNSNKNDYNKIIQSIPSFISTLYYLTLPDILIISKNIYFADIILSIINNVNITLILYYNNNNNDDIIKLKKIKNITIHILDNTEINYSFYKTIKKIIGDIKYSSIIIDPGNIIKDYYQEFFICISLLLCNKNLIIKGTFINYCLMPYLDNNYLYLLYILQNNFYLNYINSVSNYNYKLKHKYIIYINVNFNKNLTKENIKNIKYILKGIDLNIKQKINNDYLIYLNLKWKEFYIYNNKFYKNIFKINYKN
jgi:hypothetical protein